MPDDYHDFDPDPTPRAQPPEPEGGFMAGFGLDPDVEEKVPEDLWLDPAETIARMAYEGDPVQTGFAPIDRVCRRGGIPPGRLVIIGGPPSSGKTTLVAQIIVKMSERIPCFALFQDEGRGPAAARIGTMLGVDIETIEERPQVAGGQVKDRMGERVIRLLKPDAETSCAKGVVDYANAHRNGDEPALIVLDSLQKVPSWPPDMRAGEIPEWQQVKKLVTDTRNWAEEHRLIFLFTSEAVTGLFREKDESKNVTAMSGYGGGRSAIYASDLALMLSLPDEETGIVTTRIVKNRLKRLRGDQGPLKFSIRYDGDTARMAEVDAEAAEQAEVQAGAVRLRPIVQKAHQVLHANIEGLSSGQLVELCRPARRQDIFAALKTLVAEQKVYTVAKGKSVTYFAKQGVS